MHAYLVTGNSTERRSEKVAEICQKHGVSPSRILSFSEQLATIGIETIREVTHLASATASNVSQAVVIEDAHKITPVAQNAFLKTLEEPPPNTIVILSARTDDVFLPTIQSRCILIPATSSTSSISPKELEEQKALFERLRNAGVGEKIKFTEDTGKSREDAINFVEGQLLLLHHYLKGAPKVKNTSDGGPERSRRNSSEVSLIGKTLLSALSDLRHNVNPKMTLFELLKKY